MKEAISLTGSAHTGHRTCAHGNGLPLLWEVRLHPSIDCLHRHEVQGLQISRHLLDALRYLLWTDSTRPNGRKPCRSTPHHLLPM